MRSLFSSPSSISKALIEMFERDTKERDLRLTFDQGKGYSSGGDAYTPECNAAGWTLSCDVDMRSGSSELLFSRVLVKVDIGTLKDSIFSDQKAWWSELVE